MGDRPSARGGDPLGGGLGGVGVSAVDHHPGAVPRQQRGDGCADTPRPADHDSAAVGEQ
jgi:hypothetical protein